MIHLTSNTRLTDELERQLMMQAIEEQFRPRPLRALKRLLGKLKVAAPQTRAAHTGELVSSR
jgi:hypothetical protein